ncbi:hypothetical protein OA264_00645 [Alphaproteobacteria bacterium]|nr:hypothetical protein [Alphaproteobacteria bacterium]
MQKKYEKLFGLFFREAELGNWENIKIENIAKKLNINENNLRNLIPNKNHFLTFYNINVDNEVIKEISSDEIKMSSNDEIIQEYFMHKLEIMSKYRFGIANILNASIKDPTFLIINLKANKESISKFLKKVKKKKKNMSQVVLTKLLLAVWFLAFNEWLYNEDAKDAGYSRINKGISKIKNSTNLFTKI